MKTLQVIVIIALLVAGVVVSALPSLAASHSPLLPSATTITDGAPPPAPAPVPLGDIPHDCPGGGC